jgi:hypothetical protein
MRPASPAPDIVKIMIEAAVDAMVEWFFDNFEDPVHATPWEGDYVYIWGGPYDANEELEDAFGDKLEEQFGEKLRVRVIAEAVDRIEEDGFEWAPSESRLIESKIEKINV